MINLIYNDRKQVSNCPGSRVQAEDCPGRAQSFRRIDMLFILMEVLVI
jgi:hypothetical protein